MLEAKINEGGTRLVLTINGDERDDLFEVVNDYNKSQTLIAELLHEKWEFVSNIGELTDSPILCDDVEYNDSGEVVNTGKLAWYPDYCLTNPWGVLAETGEVQFTIA
jgi:hypothetical protein